MKKNYLIKGMFIAILYSFSLSLIAQTVSVHGKITDTFGEPVIGANITVENISGLGTVTDIDGNYRLSNVPNNSTLIVSFIGMTTQRIAVSSSTVINVVLEDEIDILGEVVVVGFGQQKKESVVGAIASTSSKELVRTGGVTSLGQALTGNLPGVVTMTSTGKPGEEDPEIRIRGVSSWNSGDPLVLVDGVERPMSSVDINSVASISVLKDASATAVFGVRGANGVILITTKRGQEGKANFDINVSTTMKTHSKLPDLKDSYDALMIRNQVIENELGYKPEAWSYY